MALKFYFIFQLKKTSEVTDKLPSPEFGVEWVETLCEVRSKGRVGGQRSRGSEWWVWLFLKSLSLSFSSC